MRLLLRKNLLLKIYLFIQLGFLPVKSYAVALSHSAEYIKLVFSSIMFLNKNQDTEKKVEVKNKIAVSTAISKSDLPKILYDHRALLDVMNEIPMSPQVKEKATQYLKSIEQNVNDINRYLTQEHVEHFYQPMKESTLNIHNIASALYELTKPYHLTLSNALKKLILQSITLFEISLNKKLEMPVADKESLILKSKRFYAEQSYIARQKELQKRLMGHLNQIKQLLAETGNPAPRCYISYAWPSKENFEQEYWVQPFLSTLYSHLTTAGIRVLLDVRDNKPGDSIYKFMEQYHDGNYIILIGTESLLQKHYSAGTPAVQTELSIITRRFEQDQKQFGYSRVYPLLISGTLHTSFPEIYDKYRTVRDAREMGGYLHMLQGLIDWIYEQRIIKTEPAYTNLWRAFNNTFQGLPKDADVSMINQELSLGYHRQSLASLKQDLQLQDTQKKS